MGKASSFYMHDSEPEFEFIRLGHCILTCNFSTSLGPGPLAGVSGYSGWVVFKTSKNITWVKLMYSTAFDKSTTVQRFQVDLT